MISASEVELPLQLLKKDVLTYAVERFLEYYKYSESFFRLSSLRTLSTYRSTELIMDFFVQIQTDYLRGYGIFFRKKALDGKILLKVFYSITFLDNCLRVTPKPTFPSFLYKKNYSRGFTFPR